MRTRFHYGEKVMITGGIHADMIGEVRSYSPGFIFSSSRWLLYIEYPNGKWDIDYVNDGNVQPLEEEEIPHPEYLKW